MMAIDSYHLPWNRVYLGHHPPTVSSGYSQRGIEVRLRGATTGQTCVYSSGHDDLYVEVPAHGVQGDSAACSGLEAIIECKRHVCRL
jgi:hypothetical protein